MPVIQEMWAWIADEGADDEGVVAMRTDNGWFPLVGSDRARVESMREVVQSIATERGVSLKLYRWRMPRKLVDEVKPEKGGVEA